jgi:hypothetical protein
MKPGGEARTGRCAWAPAGPWPASPQQVVSKRGESAYPQPLSQTGAAEDPTESYVRNGHRAREVMPEDGTTRLLYSSTATRESAVAQEQTLRAVSSIRPPGRAAPLSRTAVLSVGRTVTALVGMRGERAKGGTEPRRPTGPASADRRHGQNGIGMPQRDIEHPGVTGGVRMDLGVVPRVRCGQRILRPASSR